jgi:hypothetical protein
MVGVRLVMDGHAHGEGDVPSGCLWAMERANYIQQQALIEMAQFHQAVA